MGREWQDGEMRDGIRKVRNARASKATGKDVYSWKVPYRDANAKQTSATFDELGKAKTFRNKIRQQRDEGLTIDPKAGRISVTEYAATWLAAAAAKREGTYVFYERNVRLHIVPALGGRQLRAVTRSDVQEFVNALTPKLAPVTVLGVYKTLVGMFRTAHALDNKIPASPCVGIVLPEIPDRHVEVLTAAQVRDLAACTPQRWTAAVLVAAGTGLRVSEVAALTWDRIDLEKGTLTVNRQMNRRAEFAPVKTKRSRRIVPLPDMVVKALREHREAFPPVEQEVRDSDGKTHRAALVFTTQAGLPANYYTLRDVMRRARKAANLPWVTWHILRHTYASLLIAAGTSLTAIRDRMGHGSIKITADTYGHLYPTEDDRTRTAIDDAFTTDDPRADTPAGR